MIKILFSLIEPPPCALSLFSLCAIFSVFLFKTKSTISAVLLQAWRWVLYGVVYLSNGSCFSIYEVFTLKYCI